MSSMVSKSCLNPGPLGNPRQGARLVIGLQARLLKRRLGLPKCLLSKQLTSCRCKAKFLIEWSLAYANRQVLHDR
jgi:hypothetical protein